MKMNCRCLILGSSSISLRLGYNWILGILNPLRLSVNIKSYLASLSVNRYKPSVF